MAAIDGDWRRARNPGLINERGEEDLLDIDAPPRLIGIFVASPLRLAREDRPETTRKTH